MRVAQILGMRNITNVVNLRCHTDAKVHRCSSQLSGPQRELFYATPANGSSQAGTSTCSSSGPTADMLQRAFKLYHIDTHRPACMICPYTHQARATMHWATRPGGGDDDCNSPYSARPSLA